MNYEPVIGLEIHVELKTKSGMFCGCPNDPTLGKKPNIYTCPVCLGLPGALPIPNKKAIESTIMLGLALGSQIAEVSKFDRKHYFYPDLPKGYQISQYDQPFCVGGKLSTSFGDVGLRRIHLEEDTGKLTHTVINGKRVSLVDFNRSGTPLMEIVTEPDIKSSEHAKEFLKKLHQIIRYLDISDAEMEKGSMRVEPNVSLRAIAKQTGSESGIATSSRKAPRNDQELPPYKVEVKNINSFNFAKKAIDYEIERHARILDTGKLPIQETRGWNESKNATVSQRTKEEASDYRYFPEPDIPPIRITRQQVTGIREKIGEMPQTKLHRFMTQYSIRESDAEILTEDRELADYFEEAVKAINASKSSLTPQGLANWIINKKPNIDQVMPATLVKQILEATQVVEMDVNALSTIVTQAINGNPKAAADYKAGKTQSLMYLVGTIMRQVKGMATADQVKKKLEELLT